MRALIDQHKTYVMRYPVGLNKYFTISEGYIVQRVRRTCTNLREGPKGVHLHTFP